MTRAGTRSTHTCPYLFSKIVYPASQLHSPIAKDIKPLHFFSRGIILIFSCERFLFLVHLLLRSYVARRLICRILVRLLFIF